MYSVLAVTIMLVFFQFWVDLSFETAGLVNSGGLLYVWANKREESESNFNIRRCNFELHTYISPIEFMNAE